MGNIGSIVFRIVRIHGYLLTQGCDQQSGRQRNFKLDWIIPLEQRVISRIILIAGPGLCSGKLAMHFIMTDLPSLCIIFTDQFDVKVLNLLYGIFSAINSRCAILRSFPGRIAFAVPSRFLFFPFAFTRAQQAHQSFGVGHNQRGKRIGDNCHRHLPVAGRRVGIQRIHASFIGYMVSFDLGSGFSGDRHLAEGHFHAQGRLDFHIGILGQIEAHVIGSHIGGQVGSFFDQGLDGSAGILSGVAVLNQHLDGGFLHVHLHGAHLDTFGQSAFGNVGRDNGIVRHGGRQGRGGHHHFGGLFFSNDFLRIFDFGRFRVGIHFPVLIAGGFSGLAFRNHIAGVLSGSYFIIIVISGILAGDHFGVVAGILSGQSFSVVVAGILAGDHFGIVTGIFSGLVFSVVVAGILAGDHFGIVTGILSGLVFSVVVAGIHGRHNFTVAISGLGGGSRSFFINNSFAVVPFVGRGNGLGGSRLFRGSRGHLLGFGRRGGGLLIGRNHQTIAALCAGPQGHDGQQPAAGSQIHNLGEVLTGALGQGVLQNQGLGLPILLIADKDLNVHSPGGELQLPAVLQIQADQVIRNLVGEAAGEGTVPVDGAVHIRHIGRGGRRRGRRRRGSFRHFSGSFRHVRSWSFSRILRRSFRGVSRGSFRGILGRSLGGIDRGSFSRILRGGFRGVRRGSFGRSLRGSRRRRLRRSGCGGRRGSFRRSSCGSRCRGCSRRSRRSLCGRRGRSGRGIGIGRGRGIGRDLDPHRGLSAIVKALRQGNHGQRVEQHHDRAQDRKKLLHSSFHPFIREPSPFSK